MTHLDLTLPAPTPLTVASATAHRDRYEPLFGLFPTTRGGLRHEDPDCASRAGIGATCYSCIHIEPTLDVHSGRHRWADLETWVRTLATLDKYATEVEHELGPDSDRPDQARAGVLGGHLAVAYRSAVLGPSARRSSNIPDLVVGDTDRYRAAREGVLDADANLHQRLTALVRAGAGVRLLRLQVLTEPDAPVHRRGHPWWLVVPSESASAANPSVTEGLPLAARGPTTRLVLIDDDLLNAMAGTSSIGEYSPHLRARTRPGVTAAHLELALTLYETSSEPSFADILNAVLAAHH